MDEHTSYLMFFIELLNLFLTIISDAALYDDVKLAATSCVVALAEPSRPLYPVGIALSLPMGLDPIKNSISLMGYGISQMLDLTLVTKIRELKIEAMLAILHLSQKLAPYKEGEVLACFFPGIASSLGKVILGDFKQGHMVIGTAVQVYLPFFFFSFLFSFSFFPFLFLNTYCF